MTAASRLGVLLAPGAGAGRDQATLVELDRALAGSGARVARMDFPYRRAGRKAPDRPPVLMASLREEAEALRSGCDRLVLGGRSMGGRIASMVAADDQEDDLGVVGLLLISYPLHPPGRPDRLRTDHFGSIRVPCLFVSGTRDAFATPAEMEAATAAIPGRVTHRWIEGKDHALRGMDEQLAHLAVEWAAGLDARSG